MSATYPNSWKRCATCAFWAGPRETDYWGSWAKVESATAQYKCIIPRGGFKNHPMSPTSTCSDWQKWPPLK